MKRFILVVLLAANAFAQEKPAGNTIRLAEGAKRPAATIADAAWLAGHWTGEGLGGVSEEVWTAPAGGSMLGMYRLIRDGKPVFYELLTLVEENGSLVMKLKHFTAAMVAWEEKEKTVDFRLAAIQEGLLQFDSLTFRRDSETEMTIYLALRQDGKVREEIFRMKRAPAAR